MRSNKTTLGQQRDFYRDMFGEDSCCPECEGTKEEYDMAIADCNAMLQDSLDRKDKEEIAYWRKLLQENKVQRRMLTS